MAETQVVSDMYPLHNLLSIGDRMPESCKKVAKFIIDNPQRVPSMSIGELAKETASSTSAVVRVSKLSGYKGYRAFRAALLENRGILRGAEMLGFDVPFGAHHDDDFLNLAREVIKINIEVLHNTLVLLNEKLLQQAVNKILSAKHVVLVGFGTSAPVVQDAYQRLLRLQIPSSTSTDPHVLASLVANLGADDLLFCVSYTGASRDVIEALETAREAKAFTITLTSVPSSMAAQRSDFVLVAGIQNEPIARETVASRVAQLAIIDIICTMICMRKQDELREPNQRLAAELRKKRIGPNSRFQNKGKPTKN